MDEAKKELKMKKQIKRQMDGDEIPPEIKTNPAAARFLDDTPQHGRRGHDPQALKDMGF